MQPNITLIVNDVPYHHIVTIHFSTDLNHEPVIIASTLFGQAYTFPLSAPLIMAHGQPNILDGLTSCASIAVPDNGNNIEEENNNG